MAEATIGEGFRGPDGHVGYLLRQAQRAFDAALAAHLGPLGLTPRQYSVLTVLDTAGPLSSSELARTAMVAAQSMHELLGHLARAELIERRPHPANGRIQLVRPTRRGRRLLARARRRVDELEQRSLAGLDGDERARLGAWLVHSAREMHEAAEGR